MNLPRFAVTPGEPAGIGPDLCLQIALREAEGTRPWVVLAVVVALPVAAQAAPAPSTARTAASVEDGSEFGGGSGFGNALIIIAIAAVGMLALILSDDDADSPVSP